MSEQANYWIRIRKGKAHEVAPKSYRKYCFDLVIKGKL